MKKSITNFKIMEIIKSLIFIFFFFSIRMTVIGQSAPIFDANIATIHSTVKNCGSLTPNITGNVVSITNATYPVNPTTSVNGCGPVVYKWQYSDLGTYGSWTDINSFSSSNIDFPNNITYTNNGSSDRVFYIRRAVYDSCSIPTWSQTEAWTSPIKYTIYPPFTSSITAQTNVNCFNSSTGAATVTVVGSTPNYTYRWYSGTNRIDSTLSTPSFSNSINNLNAGTYDVTINSTTGCSTSTSVTINQATQLSAIISSYTEPSCIANNGSIDLYVSGGTPPYSYAWTKNSSAFANTEDLTSLSTGTYAVTITDSQGCQASTTINLNTSSAPSPNPISGSATLCEGTLNSAYSVVLHTYGQPLPPAAGHGTPGDNPDGSVNNYAWSYSGTAIINATSSVNAITMNFGAGTTSGILTVIETIPNTGCSYTNTLSITVIPLPANAGTISGANTVCQNQTLVTYTVPAITNATSYIWTLPTGATGTSTTNSITVNYSTTAISGNITVKGHNSCGDGIISSLSVTVNPLPVTAGEISGLSTVCQGQSSVNYTVPAITNATSYVWMLPSGASGTSTTNSITVNYSPTAVSGNITVKGHNSCGDGIVSNLAILVNSLPYGAGAISGTTTVCQGQLSVTYSISAILNATTYIWTLPTGTTGTSSTNSITVNYESSAISGNITVRGNNACGIGDISTLAITVNPLPVTAGTISGSSTVCQNQNSVTYTVPSITNATTYSWTLPTGASGTSTTNSITVNYSTSAVSGNITVKGHNSCGDGNLSTMVITVNPLPIAAATISGNSFVCQGQNNITYTVPTITNATSYIWTLPTGASGTSSTNSITVNYGTNAVSGNITVKGHNDCGDGAISTLTITINLIPVNAGIISGTTNVCQGQTNFTYSVPTITNASTYIWTLPTGASGTSSTNSITVNYGTSVISGNITVKGNNSCGDGISSSIAITVNPLPFAAGTITGATNVCQSQSSVTYSLPTITNATSYICSLPTGTTGSSTSNSIIVNYSTTAVSGNITVKGNNSCGDGNISTLAIIVNPLPIAAGTITGSNSVCQGQSAVNYTVPTITNASSYTWTLPTAASGSSSTNNITVNYSTSAVSGNIMVTGHNSCGDGNISTMAITVNPLPLSAGTISGTTTVCQGQSNIIYTVPAILNASSYIWTLPTGALGTSSTNSITVNYGTSAVSGNITVKGHNNCGDGLISTLPITVTPLPTANISYAGNPYCISLTAQQPVTLTGTTGGIYSSTSGLQISQSTGAILPVTSTAGTYIVSYTIASAGGCAAVIATTTVTINTLPVIIANTSATSVCFGGSIILYGSGALSYIWDNSVIDSIQFFPTTTKTYTVTGTDINGCKNTANVSVVVKPIPSVVTTTPGSRCGNGIVTLGATASAGSINWYTSLTGGTSIYSGTFYDPSLSTTTTYYVDATSNGCTSRPRTAVVATVNTIPLVSFTGLNSAYCLNANAITLVGSPLGGTFSGTGINGNTFTPLSTTAGIHTITYTYTDGNNCTNSATQNVTVNALTVVSFTGLNSSYCINAAAATLVGSPLGGTFSGAGISENTFIPTIATTGLHTITYTYTDGNNCTNSATQNVTINALPTVNFTGLNSAYCLDAAAANLVGSPLGGTFSGAGISGLTFTASIATEGFHVISYTYTDGNACTNNITQNVTVNTLPSVNADSYPTVCSNSTPLALGGFPTGGIWSGIGVSANMFSPSYGTQILTYTYTDPNTCVNSATALINVTTLPSASISYSLASYCKSVSTPQAVVLTGASGGIFSSAPGLDLNSITGAIIPSTSIAGIYTVSYTIPAASGCPEVISTTSVTINALPTVIANSSAISAVCAGTAVTLTGSGTTGVSYTWDQSVINGVPFTSTITKIYLLTGTDSNGCQKSASIEISVNPGPPNNPITGAAILCAATLNSPYSVILHSSDQPLPPGSGHGSPGDFPNGSVNNYTWSYSGNASIIAGSNVNVITINFGTDTTSGILTVVETDPISGCSFTNTKTITVNPLPIVNAGTYAAVCIDAADITLAGSPTAGVWSGIGVNGNLFDPSAGTQTLNYTFTDSQSPACSNSNQTTIIVNSLPIVTANSTDSSVCAGSNLTLTGSGAFTYVWDNSIINATPFIPNFTKTYTVIGTDVNGCKNTANTTVTIKSIPTVISTTAGSRCGSGSVTLSATPSAGSINWYTGLTGGTSVYTGTSYSPNLSTTTTYYADATANGCTSSPRTAIVATIKVIPVISGTTSDTRCGTGVVNLSATASSGTINWYEDLTGGSSINTGASYSPSVSTTTSYFVDANFNECTSITRTAVLATVNTIPTVSGTNPAIRCGAGIVNLGATASSGIINWYTSITGDTSIYTGTNYSPFVSTTTIYYVDATAIGCTSSARTAISATVLTIPDIVSSTADTICGSGFVTLDATATSGIINWYSNISGGLSINTGNSYSPSISATTTYYVDATENGCTTSPRIAVTGIVKVIPMITSVTPGSICGQGTVTLGATSSSGSIDWYTDPYTTSSVANGNSFSPSISSTTNYYIDATDNGCTSSPRTLIVATYKIQPTVTANSTASIICSGAAVTLTASGSTGATYAWDNGVINGVSFNPVITNTYTVTATNSNGCQKTASVIVNVNTSPLNNPINGTTILCEGTLNASYSVVLRSNGEPLPPNTGHGLPGDLPDGSSNNYVWSYSGIATINATSNVNAVSINFSPGSTSGILTVVESVPSTGCSFTNTLAITVHPLPVNAGSISGSNTVCQGQSSVNYTVPAITNATSYIWTLPIGATGTSTNNSITVNYNTTAVSGNITVKGSNNCGYGIPSELTITVNPLPASAGIITGSSTVCQGEYSATYNVPIIINATSYIWTLPVGVTGASSSNSIIANYSPSAVSGNITVKGNNNCGFGNSSTLAINVTSPPAISTFTAAVSNAWEVCANWDYGIPGPLTNAYIAANKLAIVNSTNYQCNNLTIAPLGKLTINSSKSFKVNGTLTMQSDASGTASLIDYGNLQTIGNIVERYIPHTNTDEFHMLASPVSNQSINPNFNQLDGFYLWNEPTANWIEFANTGNFLTANGGYNFVPGRGYAVSYPTVVKKIFTGNLNTGTLTLPIAYTTGLYSGWNFIANPYPSAINWNATSGWTRNVLADAGSGEKAIWVWNASTANYGAYISNAALGTNSVSRLIPSAQGFWVKASTAGTLSMSNSIREHANLTFLKSTTTIPDLLRLSVNGSTNSYSDELIIQFGNTNDLGGAEKMFSMDATAPGIYSIKSGKNWSISMLTSIADHPVIPLGFKAGINGSYTITASDVNSFTSPCYSYLKDLATNTITDLNQNTTYTFTASTTDNTNRFQLLFAALPLGITNNSTQNTCIYAYNNRICVNSNEEVQQICIYNTVGQLLKTIEKTNSNTVISMKEFAAAYYIVKVITAKNVYAEKVLVK
ncbi:MAG: T9SS type A sorting domain-containing protein [Bacteroidales bacterium]